MASKLRTTKAYVAEVLDGFIRNFGGPLGNKEIHNNLRVEHSRIKITKSFFHEAILLPDEVLNSERIS